MYIEKVLDLGVQLMKNGSKIKSVPFIVLLEKNDICVQLMKNGGQKCCVYNFVQYIQVLVI